MRINEIQDLIKFVSKSGVSEVNLETDKIKLVIKNTPKERKGKELEQTIVQVPQQVIQQAPMAQMPIAAAPIAVAASAPVAAVPVEAVTPEEDSNYITVKSPMIGTFYRRPSPDKVNFVEVGSDIKTGDVICIIEAMKLFNEIEAEITGKIVKVLVDDSTPVEYDQPLFIVDPS
jgi:acetyl-CoA carboxylase biotin carboxyl carrier protein